MEVIFHLFEMFETVHFVVENKNCTVRPTNIRLFMYCLLITKRYIIWCNGLIKYLFMVLLVLLGGRLPFMDQMGLQRNRVFSSSSGPHTFLPEGVVLELGNFARSLKSQKK